MFRAFPSEAIGADAYSRTKLSFSLRDTVNVEADSSAGRQD
jgi:hypothetical protein